MQINSVQLEQLDTRYRARLINSISGFKSANLVGTTSLKREENLSIVSSVFHLGASPALMGFIIRPNTAERHTLENILETKHYTINGVSRAIYVSAHHTSARFEKGQSEFRHAALTPTYYPDFPSPFVSESPLQIGLKLREHQTLKVNQTELIIGEIQVIRCASDSVMPDGYIDVEQLDLVAVSGLDSYHVTNRLNRLSYAKPDKQVHPLTREGEPSSWQALA